jgi:branched-chain amino acid transport system substrate-binding protein
MRFVASLLSVLLVLALAACGDDGDTGSAGADGGADGGAEGGTITYGLIASLSGPAAPFGMAEKASIELAADKINEAGGVDVGGKNYKFEVKSYDSGDDPTKGVTVAQQAFNKDGVRFLEVFGGNILPAMQPVAESANAMIFGMAIENNYLGPDHPNTFSIYLNLRDTTVNNVKVLQEKIDAPEPHLVFLQADDEVGHNYTPEAEQAVQELGFTTHTEYIAADVTDFAGILGKVLDKDPSIIDFGGMNPAQYAVAVKQARQLGYEGFFSFPNVVDMEVLTETAGQEAAVGSVGSPEWDVGTTGMGKEWATDIESKSGGDPAQDWTAISFDTLFLLAAALEEAGSLEPDKVTEALLNVTIDGALGEGIRFKEDHNLLSGYKVVEIQPDGSLKPVATAAE